MKKYLLVSLIAFLAGCASVPSDAPPYSPAPQAQAGKGILYIYRLGAFPTQRTPGILIDGKKVFDPPEKAYTWVHLSEGNHVFTVDWAWDTGWPDLNFEIPIEGNKDHYIKITGDFETTLFFHEMTSEAKYVDKVKAEEELRLCCKYIPAE